RVARRNRGARRAGECYDCRRGRAIERREADGMNGSRLGCSESQTARAGYPAAAPRRAGVRWLRFAARLVGGLGLLVLACTPAGGGTTASKPAASTSAPAPPPTTGGSASVPAAASAAPAAPAGPVPLTVGAVSPNALVRT